MKCVVQKHDIINSVMKKVVCILSVSVNLDLDTAECSFESGPTCMYLMKEILTGKQ